MLQRSPGVSFEKYHSTEPPILTGQRVNVVTQIRNCLTDTWHTNEALYTGTALPPSSIGAPRSTAINVLPDEPPQAPVHFDGGCIESSKHPRRIDNTPMFVRHEGGHVIMRMAVELLPPIAL